MSVEAIARAIDPYPRLWDEMPYDFPEYAERLHDRREAALAAARRVDAELRHAGYRSRDSTNRTLDSLRDAALAFGQPGHDQRVELVAYENARRALTGDDQTEGAT